MVERIVRVYFSPSGKTKEVVDEIAAEAGRILNLPSEEVDYTLPEQRKRVLKFRKGDLVIWGTPVYAGRIPNKTLPFVQSCVEGNGAYAVPVVVFGNRSMDQALAELAGELKKNGFLIAGGAFVAARHSMSEVLGKGRPDEKDKEKLRIFSEQLACKMSDMKKDPDPVRIPGEGEELVYYVPKREDGEPARFLKAKPKLDRERCTGCGLCAEVCPMGSIDRKDPALVPGICIKCHACIRKCPEGARYFDDEDLISHKKMLEKNFMERKEPGFYL